MALLPEFFPDIEAFQWDEANSTKNWDRHRVSATEAEQVFLNRPVLIANARVGAETRWFAYGRSDAARLLTVVFTVRGRHIRVISARPMARMERKHYGEAISI